MQIVVNDDDAYLANIDVYIETLGSTWQEGGITSGNFPSTYYSYSYGW